MGSCSIGQCSTSFSFIIGKNMVDGNALIGYVFANVSVAGVMDCYKACRPNCRCISFNYLTDVNKNNCELNEESRYTNFSALKPLEGSQYYDLIVSYDIRVRKA